MLVVKRDSYYFNLSNSDKDVYVVSELPYLQYSKTLKIIEKTYDVEYVTFHDPLKIKLIKLMIMNDFSCILYSSGLTLNYVLSFPVKMVDINRLSKLNTDIDFFIRSLLKKDSSVYKSYKLLLKKQIF